jgi:hypothetical protein
MNEIETLEQELLKRVPGLTAVLDRPLEIKHSWMLDVRLMGNTINIEWRPERGFSLVHDAAHVYGQGPDESFSDVAKTVERVCELFQEREKKKNNRKVERAPSQEGDASCKRAKVPGSEHNPTIKGRLAPLREPLLLYLDHSKTSTQVKRLLAQAGVTFEQSYGRVGPVQRKPLVLHGGGTYEGLKQIRALVELLHFWHQHPLFAKEVFQLREDARRPTT